MREALEPHELGNADRSVLRDPPDVVAAKVDEHDVLGPLLLVTFQLLRQPGVFLAALSPWTRARDGMRLHASALDADQHFGRGADDGNSAHADEVHVRRRVDVSERAINGKWIRGDVRLETLRQHHLIDVAGGDVLFGGADAVLELLARAVRCDPKTVAARPARAGEVTLKLALEKLDFRTRELIERLKVFVRRHSRVGDDQDAMLDVVERQDRIEEHEPRLIGAVDARAEIAEDRLEP